VRFYDTSASTLSFLLSQVAYNSAIQERLYNEVSEFIKLNGENYKFSDVDKLEYLNAVLLETGRHVSLVPFLTRVAMDEMEIGNGIKVHTGDVLYCITPGIHKDESYWGPKVEEFNPENYLGPKAQDNTRDNLAFGFGKRICPGKSMASHLIKLAVVEFVSKFQFVKHAENSHPATVTFPGVGFVHADGTRVRIKIRN
jgi:cytochrome P450